MSRTGITTTEVNLGTIVSEINYTPEAIDEYLVVVNLPEDWKEVHNYIVNENEIDGIPNRRIDIANEKPFSLRTSVYMMSAEEAEVLKTYPKVESVVLNPDKYPQPASTSLLRFNKDVPFNKPLMPNDLDGVEHPLQYKDNIHSNWAHTFVNDPVGFPNPYSGVGIGSTTVKNTDLKHSYTGKNVDAIIIDTGCGVLHPEFISPTGEYRMRDVVIDGPYYVDPDYFINNNHTYTKVLSGKTIGVGIATDKAREWWTDATKRSAQFQSLGTISFISSLYTYAAGVAADAHTDDATPITDSHGTSCAAQIGGKSFGLAYECNLWSIRVNLGDGFPIDGGTALDVASLFHQAKKISQAGDVNPTIVNNSWGSLISGPGNTNGNVYTVHYRGSTTTYTGNGAGFPSQAMPVGSESFLFQKTVRYKHPIWAPNGSYLNYGWGRSLHRSTSRNSSAEDAINNGVIVVACLMNENHKQCDKNDVDFNNWHTNSAILWCRSGGVQQGFSGDHEVGKGTIRVGALDCAVEPAGDGAINKQGTQAYQIRKVTYSGGGNMVDIFSPGEMTMSAVYKPTADYNSGVDFVRPDANDGTDAGTFYDTYFNGTSAATPNAVSLMCLYLESNRKATQQDVRKWLTTVACKDNLIADPYPDPNDTGYWVQPHNDTFDLPTQDYDSYNPRGGGSLKGAPNKVTYNPFATNKTPKFNGVKVNGIRYEQS